MRTCLALVRRRSYLDILEAIIASLKRIGIFIQISEFFTCDHDRLSPDIRISGFIVRDLHPDDIETIAAFSGKRSEVLRERVEKFKEECQLIYFQDKLAGYCWLAFETMRVPELEYEEKLGDNNVYLYDSLIRDDLRNRGLLGLYLIKTIRNGVAQHKRFLISIDISNYKSRQACTKIGFTKIGTLILIKLWSLVRLKSGYRSLKEKYR